MARSRRGNHAAARSVSAEEVERFNALAASWWDPDGPMRPLHRMNPARIAWIAERIGAAISAMRRLRLLDVGCGAGLAAEALARAGFDVLGLDAAGEAIEAARAHAAGQGCRSPTAPAWRRNCWPKGCASRSSPHWR